MHVRTLSSLSLYFLLQSLSLLSFALLSSLHLYHFSFLSFFISVSLLPFSLLLCGVFCVVLCCVVVCCCTGLCLLLWLFLKTVDDTHVYVLLLFLFRFCFSCVCGVVWEREGGGERRGDRVYVQNALRVYVQNVPVCTGSPGLDTARIDRMIALS